MIERRSEQVLRCVVLTLMLTMAADGVRATALRVTFDAAGDGAADVAYALLFARTQGKRVIVDVCGEWWSRRDVLDRFIAANDDIRGAIDAHYVRVEVGFPEQNERRAALARWPTVAVYPHLFVLDASGAVLLWQITEALESRSKYDKARFLAFLAKGAGGLSVARCRATADGSTS